MKFNDLYLKTIKYFPSDIDISEGKFIEETQGFRCEILSKVRRLAEAHSKNDWEELLIWNIYKLIHRKAKSLYVSDDPKLMIVADAIDLDVLEKMYFEALQIEGHEDMLKEYLENRSES
jgi:hypothetical protein